MTVKETMFALLIVLIALAWAGKDWLADMWYTMTQNQRLGWSIVLLLFFSLVFYRLLTPFLWQNFS